LISEALCVSRQPRDSSAATGARTWRPHPSCSRNCPPVLLGVRRDGVVGTLANKRMQLTKRGVL
jgi:hypothetical protein